MGFLLIINYCSSIYFSIENFDYGHISRIEDWMGLILIGNSYGRNHLLIRHIIVIEKYKSSRLVANWYAIYRKSMKILLFDWMWMIDTNDWQINRHYGRLPKTKTLSLTNKPGPIYEVSECTFSIKSMQAYKSIPKSINSQCMPSRVYSSCSKTNIWWLKNCCNLSLVKLFETVVLNVVWRILNSFEKYRTW